MTGGGERSFEDWIGVAGACVPEQDLTGVGTSYYDVWVEGTEGD